MAASIILFHATTAICFASTGFWECCEFSLSCFLLEKQKLNISDDSKEKNLQVYKKHNKYDQVLGECMEEVEPFCLTGHN